VPLILTLTLVLTTALPQWAAICEKPVASVAAPVNGARALAGGVGAMERVFV
jgi:hypothetical protein